jgi:hypothetical protein
MWALTEEFLSRFAEEAAARGWRLAFVRDDDVAKFAREQDDGLEAGLGLDITPRDWGLSLNPGLSVRHVKVSELSARFFGLERGAAQVGATLLDLMNRSGQGVVMWTVEKVDEIPAVTAKVLLDIERYGEPFFAQYESLIDIIPQLEDRSAKINFDYAHLAVAYAIAGELPKAISVLLRLEELADNQPEFVAVQTRQFISRFRDHFDVGGATQRG